jgi:hypothetical protein
MIKRYNSDGMWHLFPEKYSDKLYLCEILLKNNFNVWVWKNSNRITLKGDEADLSLMVLTEVDTSNFSFLESKYPNPSQSSLAVKLTKDSYLKE